MIMVATTLNLGLHDRVGNESYEAENLKCELKVSKNLFLNFVLNLIYYLQ